MAHSADNPTLLDTSGLHLLPRPRVGVVYTAWNERIVLELLKGFDRVCRELDADVVERLGVPGAFELPFGCRMVMERYADEPTRGPEVLVAFGAVIRGGTSHFEYVCKAVTEGILHLNLTGPVPVIFGVLTLNGEAQADERLGGSQGHKGEEAAVSALRMVAARRNLAVK